MGDEARLLNPLLLPPTLSHPLPHDRLSPHHHPNLSHAPPFLQLRRPAVSARRPAFVIVAPVAALRGCSVSAWKPLWSSRPVAFLRAYAAHRFAEWLPATSCNSSS